MSTSDCITLPTPPVPAIALTPEERQERTKAANREKARRWRLKNPDKAKAVQKKYRENNPEKVKAKSARYWAKNPEKKKAKNRRYYKKHVAYIAERQKQYAQKHADRYRLYKQKYYIEHIAVIRHNQRRYQQEHPEVFRALGKRARSLRAQIRINDFTLEQWQAMKAHYNYCCVYCGKKSKRLTQDHVTPLSKGGDHTYSNIVPACGSCNSRKHTGPVLSPVQPLLLQPSA